MKALPASNDIGDLKYALTRIIGDLENKLDALANGYASVRLSASAPPTTGGHMQGDVIDNNAPSELGTAGSKYVIAGWRCVASGIPGTWVERRELTGN